MHDECYCKSGYGIYAWGKYTVSLKPCKITLCLWFKKSNFKVENNKNA